MNSFCKVYAESDLPTASSIYQALLLGLWGKLSNRRRIQLLLLMLVMLVSGIAELLSLGAAIPFLALLSDPQRLWQQPLVRELASKLD